MSIIKVSEPFILRRTKPASILVGNGINRYDLRPHMREDLTEDIGRNSQNVISSTGHNNIVNFPSQKPGSAANQTDFPFERIRAKAKSFKFRDSITGNPARMEWEYGVINRTNLLKLAPEVGDKLEHFFKNPYNPERDTFIFRRDIIKNVLNIVKDADLQEQLLNVLENAFYDTYRKRASMFWYLEAMRIYLIVAMPLKLDLVRKEQKYAEFIEIETIHRYRALDVRGGENEDETNIIWDGYLEENNFWPMFKYDSHNQKGQIDDSKDPIKGLYISPTGNFTLQYKRKTLDNECLRNAAFIGAICYNTHFLEYKF